MSSKMSFAASRFLFLPVAALSALFFAQGCLAQSVPSLPAVAPPGPATLPGSGNAIAGAVAQWSVLAKAEDYPFSSYASFLLANPGWPNEAAMRKNAEAAISAQHDSARLIVSYFRTFPPQTAAGWLRFAEALTATGNGSEAADAARSAWRKGALLPVDENKLLSGYSAALRGEDHDARMDALLWDRSTSAAQRHLPYVSSSRRPAFEARLAMLTKSSDAGTRLETVADLAQSDAGLLYDRISWLKSSSQGLTARMLLSRPMALTAPPRNALGWLKMLLAAAKDAVAAGQPQIAFDIARQANTAYAPGTVVRDRPIGERDVYTDLVWLGGRPALFQLGRPRDAIALFEMYGAGAKSPQVRSKGLYWAGRAAEAAGDRPAAMARYEQAAKFFDQFHGQLATERLGKPLANTEPHRAIEISGAERAAFEGKSLVKAMVYLGQSGRWQDQSLFIRTLSANISSDAEHVLATELSEKIQRPDLAVMVGRSARANGYTDYVWSSFPRVQVPAEQQSSWTMIHAIARQESQFDRQIVSHAGAKGLMQLMPGTARETAPRAGLVYNYGSLSDIGYNITLGSTYFGQLMDTYGGSYVLAVAAYNAGPGNVNKWLRANGDPRAGVDVLQWIEAIPLSETRNYVQRVLENAVVYDLLNPRRAKVTGPNPLSTYLGKRTPG